MNSFYLPEILQEGLVEGSEAHHALRVLRLNKNENIRLHDGNGTVAIATIIDHEKNSFRYKIIERIILPFPKTPHVTIAVAPVKSNDRLEFMVEKLTELGVYAIAWIYTQRSERKVLNPEKIKAWTVAAMKQSHSFFLPKMETYQSLNQFIDADKAQTKWVASLQSHTEVLSTIAVGPTISILIGPEGDFTPEEYSLIRQKNVESISLGENVLRTETAAIAALIKAQNIGSNI